MKKAIIITGIIILSALTFFVYLASSRVILICAIVGVIASIYFFVSLMLSRRSNKHSSKTYPAPFLLFGFLLPVGIGFALYYFDTFSLILTILLTGLTLVFFYNFLMIPLAIYDKYQEEGRKKGFQSYPQVNILVPAYNEEGYIGRCIEALLETDYPEHKIQIIVIDDGSTDGTFKEAKNYSDNDRVKLIHKENGGKHSALNYGLMFAKGDIVVTVDADSIVSRQAIKKIVNRFEQEDEIGAVAGNVEVLNRGRFMTNCQALEYLVGINIFRRALDVFGAVSVVPGCLGAFRKKLLQGGGFYDPDTLTEDFDVTVKMRKLGKTVQASTEAQVFTEVPETWKDLYSQRMRWYRGNFQTIFKHRNAAINPRFGLLQKLSFPFLVLSMTLLPLAGIVVLGSIILGILAGLYIEILSIFVFFNVLTVLTSALAIQIGEEDWRLLAFSPFLMFGYKHFLDFLKIKSLIDVFIGNTSWTSPRRSRHLDDE